MTTFLLYILSTLHFQYACAGVSDQMRDKHWDPWTDSRCKIVGFAFNLLPRTDEQAEPEINLDLVL